MEEMKKPEKDAFVVCIECGAINQFTDSYGHLRSMEQAELYLLDPVTLKFLRTLQAGIAWSKQPSN